MAATLQSKAANISDHNVATFMVRPQGLGLQNKIFIYHRVKSVAKLIPICVDFVLRKIRSSSDLTAITNPAVAMKSTP